MVSNGPPDLEFSWFELLTMAKRFPRLSLGQVSGPVGCKLLRYLNVTERAIRHSDGSHFRSAGILNSAPCWRDSFCY